MCSPCVASSQGEDDDDNGFGATARYAPKKSKVLGKTDNEFGAAAQAPSATLPSSPNSVIVKKNNNNLVKKKLDLN